tara:strand:- start:2044 stop:2415 length:372 start_codon:yes stop_codon:yes gene_type:complete
MAVISGSDYRAIVIKYAEARSKNLNMRQDFFDAVYLTVLLQSIDPEIDLLNRFHGNYLVNTQLIDSQEAFLSAVRAMQTHVINRSSATTVDEYLDAEGITVPRIWADLSLAAGFPIASSNIDS